jgi:hypothetical protein
MTEAILMQRDATPSLQLPDMIAAAERALNWGLELCARRMGLDSAQTAVEQVRQGSAVARMYCCTGIAKQVAESLAASEESVRAVYAPDQDVLFRDLCASAEAGEEATVSLLVWTRHRTAALDSLVAAWDRALTQVCRDRIGAHGQVPVLDVHITEDTDLEKLFGAGPRAATATRLAVYWMWATNQVVDIVFDRTGV